MNILKTTYNRSARRGSLLIIHEKPLCYNWSNPEYSVLKYKNTNKYKFQVQNGMCCNRTRALYRMYTLREVGGAFDRCYRPFAVRVSSLVFLFYLLVVSKRSSEQTFDINFRIAFSVSSVKQLSLRFLKHWEAPRPCCCSLTSRNRTCLKL